MIPFGIYLGCVALIILGALALISALSIPGFFRMAIACMAAVVPIVVGVWMFRSSGLQVRDLDRLVRAARADVQQVVSKIRDTQNFDKQFEDLLKR